MSPIDAEQLRAFETRGVIAPLELLTPDEVARYRAAFEATVARLGAQARIDEVHRFFSWGQELACHPRLLDAVATLLGDELLVHAVLLLSKWPGRPGLVPWHQDSFYSRWHLSPSVSAWIALSPSTVDNGCMRVIEGSHRAGPRDHDERPGPENMLWGGLTIAEAVDESRARDLVLAPGQLSLHQSNLVHGSSANRGSEVRVGFIVRFVTPAYRVTRGPVLRARGQAALDHLDELERLPPHPEGPAADALLDEQVARWREVYPPADSTSRDSLAHGLEGR